MSDRSNEPSSEADIEPPPPDEAMPSDDEPMLESDAMPSDAMPTDDEPMLESDVPTVEEGDEPTIEEGDAALQAAADEAPLSSVAAVAGVEEAAAQTRPMRPSERRAMRAAMERGQIAVDPAHRVSDRASAFFVLLTVGVFVLIMLNGLLLGHGGFLTPTPTPSPVPSVTAAPSGSPAASPTVAPSSTAAPTPTITAAPSPTPGPS